MGGTHRVKRGRYSGVARGQCTCEHIVKHEGLLSMVTTVCVVFTYHPHFTATYRWLFQSHIRHHQEGQDPRKDKVYVARYPGAEEKPVDPSRESSQYA